MALLSTCFKYTTSTNMVYEKNPHHEKTLLSNFLILLAVSAPYLSNTFAEGVTRWNLPEDAKAHLGKGKITEILYSPDGKFLAVASRLGIWLYDTTPHQEDNRLTDHTGEVESVAFSRDGHAMASGSAYFFKPFFQKPSSLY